jgi:hypothetical protein
VRGLSKPEPRLAHLRPGCLQVQCWAIVCYHSWLRQADVLLLAGLSLCGSPVKSNAASILTPVGRDISHVAKGLPTYRVDSQDEPGEMFVAPNIAIENGAKGDIVGPSGNRDQRPSRS